MFNLNMELGKFICIHCKENFDSIPKEKHNECQTSYTHFIVKKAKLKNIQEKRATIV